ncbi:MAG: type IV secretion system DNA-binding domain-containing protein [Alphaproteobacteria bacterium]|nr:type IV secretion system DNA-binding domain-containing protein [Alphaproteobacteria bacterium]
MRRRSLPGKWSSLAFLSSLPRSIFTHRYAFWFLTLHLVPVFAALGLGVALIALGQSGRMLSLLLLSYVPFLAAQLTYLVLSGRWREYDRWFFTRWARMKDRIATVSTNVHLAAERLSTSQQGGFLLTMAPASFAIRTKARKVIYRDDRHVSMIAGSRAGKGRDFIIPNLSHWRGSVIAYDPSGELVKATARYRREVLGQRVIILDPFGIAGMESDQWNPMAEIDFDGDPLAVDQCYLLAESLHFEQSPDPFWMHAPRKMLASVIGYVGTRSIPENCHLGMVRDLLMTSEPQALWLAMAQNDGLGGMLRRFGEANEHRHLEELNSTMELARTAMKWLDSPVMAAFSARSTFSMKQLKQEPTTIYIVMPAGMGRAYASWLRALFNAAFDVMQDASIAKPEEDVLFLMDEFPVLGRMERIQQAAGEAAKFGVKLFICAQDITQMKEHYGQSWETFIANAGLLIMFANNDLETQTYLSSRLGKEYYAKHSISTGSGAGASSSTSKTLELRDVARPDQVGAQVSRQSGSAFFFIPGMKPMRLPRASYDRWNMLQGYDAMPEREKEKKKVEVKRKPSRLAEMDMPSETVPVAAE